jgi:hypothetical protein
MQVGANQSYLLGLFNSSSSSSSNGIINIDLSSLAVDTASTSADGTSSDSTATGPTGPTPPTPPWNAAETTLQASSNVQNALAGLPIISQGNSVGPSPGISASDAEDYSKLFSLYQGLSTLNDIATQANSKSLSPQQQTQLANAFNSGLAQISSYVSSTDLANLRLAFGGDATTATAS